MNANWLPQMPAIKDWLTDTSCQFSKVKISTPQLDAEIILANVLKINRTYLHAHSDKIIEVADLKKADKMAKMRLSRMPIAYIIGQKEFYGRDFFVDTNTLIPRPESEAIIDTLKLIIKGLNQTLNLIDVGTGSGCLGITAKLEFFNLSVTLADISSDALKIATLNANKLLADVTTLQSDLLSDYTLKPDIIIANLPYVDKTWKTSPETKYEPDLALFAENNGKIIIEKLISQSKNLIASGGYIIIEADPAQHKNLIKFAENKSFELISQLDYIIAFKFQN